MHAGKAVEALHQAACLKEIVDRSQCLVRRHYVLHLHTYCQSTLGAFLEHAETAQNPSAALAVLHICLLSAIKPSSDQFAKA